jgi:hypothetical protein
LTKRVASQIQTPTLCSCLHNNPECGFQDDWFGSFLPFNAWFLLNFYADYSVFATPEFDANEYANALLAGEPYPPQQYTGTAKPAPTKPPGVEPAKEDISVAISKLNFGIEDVSKQIKHVVRSLVLDAPAF